VKNDLMRRRDIWPLLAGGTIPLIYLALTSTGLHAVALEPALWVCMCIGLAVAIAAFIAHKKVVP
jgi:hypothetical protein